MNFISIIKRPFLARLLPFAGLVLKVEDAREIITTVLLTRYAHDATTS